MWEKVRGVFPVTSNELFPTPNNLISTFYWKTYFVLNMQYVIHLLFYFHQVISDNNID